ncbi:hypothetical protein HPT27_10520 [Permianibacter sp. IMCC34836]|uniref:bacteriophage antitermination protein Q n=1 Tax=Permianibacter fluminis TaxID=2738515 RepID=UPI001557D1FF|nr:bacteriophage antitermination protein Q [Permianibacter fluminis]NQD37461.1 hypothetical protein [Permianibacter fluminis]
MIRLNDARDALHDAMTIQQRSGQGNLIRLAKSTAPGWRDIEALKAAKILAVTNRLNPLQCAWVNYAYGAEFNRTEFESIHQALFDVVTADVAKKVNYRMVRRWLHLSAAAMEDMQVRVLARRTLLTDAEVSRRLAVSRTHFARDWRAHWEAALNWLHELDKAAIEPVELLLAKWREEESAEREPVAGASVQNKVAIKA